MGEEVLESKKREGKASSTLQTQYITFSSAHALPKALVHGVCALNHKRGPDSLPSHSHILHTVGMEGIVNSYKPQTPRDAVKNCRQIEINSGGDVHTAHNNTSGVGLK